MDVFDYLRADVTIQGTTPKIGRESKIKVEDYHQQFSKAGHGYITSKTEHLYTIEGTNNVVTFTVDQSVSWEECSGSRGLHLTRTSSPTMRLASTRNFIIYDKNEQIVRYAMTSSISPLASSEDPCISVDCGEAGVCLVMGSSHSCSCLPGYTLHDQTEVCVDVDECVDGHSDCHQEAQCVNMPGSYTCTCRPGFIGDGKTCYGEIPVKGDNITTFLIFRGEIL